MCCKPWCYKARFAEGQSPLSITGDTAEIPGCKTWGSAVNLLQTHWYKQLKNIVSVAQLFVTAQQVLCEGKNAIAIQKIFLNLFW